MRRSIAIILLGGVFTHLFYSSGFLIDYYVNTDAYKELCENRDKPMLNCDGKCILAQKIEAANREKGGDQESTVPPIPIISLQYLPSYFWQGFDTTISLIIHQGHWQEPFLKTLVYTLLKPPTSSI